MTNTPKQETAHAMAVLDSIIRKAGGVTSLAAALGMTEGGIRYWQRRGSVPKQAARLLTYEAKHRFGIEVTPEDLSGEQ
jgi:DNA-binding transcriptional regulator YiaG